MNHIRWFRLPLAAIAVSWLGGAWGATQRYLEDGKWWIDVPAGETNELTAADVEAVMPAEGAHLDLYKIGEGTLNMATNDATLAFKDWNGNIHVTNGLMRILSEYGLGNYDNGGEHPGGVTYVHAGAALDNAYQRDEKATGTTSGITQHETIHVAGTGFGGFGALNQTVGNHIMIGRVTLDDDATFGGDNASRVVSVRYGQLDFNGHQLTVAKNAGFGTLPALNVPDVPIVVKDGATLQFTGTGISTMESGHRIRFGKGAQLQFDGGNSGDFVWELDFTSNANFIASNLSSGKNYAWTNTWSGPVTLRPGCTLSIWPNNKPIGLRQAVQGGGDLKVAGAGTFQLGAADHRIRELRMVSGAKIRLPDDFVLEIQSFKIGDSAQVAGDYTSANCACILSGTIRVNPAAQIYTIPSVSNSDYAFSGFGRDNTSVVSTDAVGVCSLAVSSPSTVALTFNGLSNVLNRARLHMDATCSSSFTYVSSDTWLSTNGLRGIKRWADRRDPDQLYFNNFSLTGEWSASKQCYHRYVSAYPTLQSYTVNGVTRPYVDLGEIYGDTDTSERYYNNSYSTSPTAAGMHARILDNNGGKSTLAGLEYHIVFGDAHQNPTNENRAALFGRPNCLTGHPDYMAGRRGAGGKLFAAANKATESFRDGRIWADNVATNYTYTPDWGEVHVYTVIPTNAFIGTTHEDYAKVGTLGVDSYARYGGSRYGEILAYSGATNTAADRARIDAYLMKKWTGRGSGAEIAFGTMTLSSAAPLKFTCPGYSDIGTCYRIATLAGDGSVAADAKDGFFIENLSPAVTATNTLARLTVENPVTFAEAGTVCIAAGRPAQGVYTILDAPKAANPEALDAWTLDNQSSRNITLRRSGTALEAVVSGSGLVIIFK